jgi:hypothetical protein
MIGSLAAAPTALDTRQAQALWLSRKMHRTIEPSQVLTSPEGALEGCTIARAQAAPTGATSLSLRCPSHALPQLVLLSGDWVTPDVASGVKTRSASDASLRTSSNVRPESVTPLVRAGANLQADWRTPFLHAEMPVVALDSGVAGAEIRVRVASSNRIMRARILTAHTVSILAGA